MSTEKKTMFKSRILAESCPFCFYPILEGESTIKTLRGISHSVCPVEAFVRKTFEAGIIGQTKKIKFSEIVPLLKGMIEEFKGVLLRRSISKEEVVRKGEVLVWASRMFLDRP